MIELLRSGDSLEPRVLDCIAKNMADVNGLAKIITLAIEEGEKTVLMLKLLYEAVRNSTPQRLALV
jgi:hypothetical protein